MFSTKPGITREIPGGIGRFTITPAPGLLCPLFLNATKRTVLGEPILDTRRELANYRSKKIEKSAFDVSTSGSTVSLEEPMPPVELGGGGKLAVTDCCEGGKSLSVECDFLEEMNEGSPGWNRAPVKVRGLHLC